MKITKGRVAVLMLAVLLAGLLAVLAMDPPEPQVSADEVEEIFSVVEMRLQREFGEGAFATHDLCLPLDDFMCLVSGSVALQEVEASLPELLPSGFEEVDSDCGRTTDRLTSSYCFSLWRRGTTVVTVQLDYPRNLEDGSVMPDGTDLAIHADAVLGWPWSWYPGPLR